jgi:Ca-activated chloride channel family protein
MLRFQYSAYLGALVLLPLLVALFVAMLYWRRKKLGQLGTSSIVQQQILGYIPARHTFKFVLTGLALLFIIIGCANLQKGGTTETVQRKGVDVMIALDVSKSMLAKDIQPDRLTRAKQFIARLTDKMSSDRVGLVIFAGRSYLQVPLTIDYSALKLLLQTVSPDMVPTQGTVIGDAIELANKSFSSKERKYKSIILISDGEDHDETALSKVKEAVEGGAIVHTIGIGSPQGTQLFDPATNSVKLDEKGEPVITKLNEAELKSIAAAGNGTYTLMGNTDAAADRILDEIDGMEQRNLGSVVYANYISYFQYFLLAALVLLLAEWLLPGALKPKTKPKVPAKTISLLALICLATWPAQAQSSKKLIANGNKLYAEGRYKDAAAQYGRALQKDTAYAGKSSYNLGNALYQQKQVEPARKAYEAAAKKATDKKGSAGANYNIGNTYMAEKKWEEAIEAYKKTLRNNPQDADAKYNLSYAKQMLKKEGGGGKDKNKDQDKKDQEQKDQQQKQDQQKQDQQKQEEQKDQQPKQGDQEKQEDEKPQPQPSKLSEKQAEQLLNALQQEEKKLQEKNKKKYGTPVKTEKDW